MKGKTTMRRLGMCLVLAFVAAACDAEDGERCNPLQYSDTAGQGNCTTGLTCIYPTAPNCGVAYCCTVDSKGNITDPNPNCQPDPSAAAACMLDMSVLDGGSGTD